MSFDPTVGNNYPGSIYSTANSTARALTFSEMGSDPEYDSIVGMEYYLMATSSAKTNFIAFLGKEGGSIRNSAYYVGIGFDKSDSIKILWTSNAVAAQENQNVAPITFGKWYKCTVEYNILNYTATYYLDNKVVGKTSHAVGVDIRLQYVRGVSRCERAGWSGPVLFQQFYPV